MTQHFVYTTDSETDFWTTSSHNLLCVLAKQSVLDCLDTIQTGDLLWILDPRDEQLIAVASYASHRVRELGELINLTPSNEELGLAEDNPADYEIHYSNLYDLRGCLCEQKKKKKTTMWLDTTGELASEYKSLLRYSKATFKGTSVPAVEPKAFATHVEKVEEDEEDSDSLASSASSASSVLTGSDGVSYRRIEHCRAITGDSGLFKQCFMRFDSDAEAEAHARENGYRYFMRGKQTEGGTYWFLQDKVRRGEPKVETDPSKSAYSCTSWVRY